MASLLTRRVSCGTVLVLLVVVSAVVTANPVTVGTLGVSVVKGTLPQSRHVAELPRVGQWTHGADKADDAAFFRDEDVVQETWLRKRRELMQRTDANGGDETGGEGATDPTTDAAQKGDQANNSPNTVDAVKNYFVSGRARSRRRALDAALNANSTLSADERIAAVAADVSLLADAVAAAAMEKKTSGLVGDLYIPLTQSCYNHTVNVLHLDGMHAGGAVSGEFSTPPFIPSPFIADRRILRAAEKELERLEAAVTTSLEAKQEETGSVRLTRADAKARRQLRDIRRVVKSSANAVENIFLLSKPLYLDGIDAAASELVTLRKRIVDNDESTEALRKEMKQLVKAKNRLQAWENELRSGLRYVRRANSVDELDTKEFSTETMVMVGLALFAHLRLGCSGHVPALEALPPPSTFTAFTGLRSTDLGLDKRPIHHVLLFFCFTALVLREINLWVLDAALASAPLRVSGQRTLKNRVYRHLYQLSGMALLLLPVAWVLCEVTRLHLRGEIEVFSFFAYITTTQKLGVLALVVGTMGVGRLLVMFVSCLPVLITDPEKRRRKKAA